jgi:hypothetical protein
MAWDMKWFDDDHTILMFTVKPDSTWNDFDVAMNKYALELGASAKTIHAIIYNEYGFSRENPVPHIRNQMHKLTMFKNKGVLVTVTPKHSANFLISVLQLVTRVMHIEAKTGVFVRTMDEALARIQLEQLPLSAKG